MVARYDHTYQQGIERFWNRKDRFDYYLPSFANLGEQAVLNKEIYAQGTAVDNQVFGYPGSPRPKRCTLVVVRLDLAVMQLTH